MPFEYMSSRLKFGFVMSA